MRSLTSHCILELLCIKRHHLKSAMTPTDWEKIYQSSCVLCMYGLVFYCCHHKLPQTWQHTEYVILQFGSQMYEIVSPS